MTFLQLKKEGEISFSKFPHLDQLLTEKLIQKLLRFLYIVLYKVQETEKIFELSMIFKLLTSELMTILNYRRLN